MYCLICGKDTVFEICEDCQEYTNMKKHIEKLQDKLKRRNTQIADLKNKIKELKELLRDNGIEC